MMRPSYRSLLLALTALAAGLLTACAATKISRITKESEFNAGAMHRVLVLAVVRKPKTQHMLEDEFVRLLKKKGVDGVASYSLIPEGTKMDEAAWKRVVADNHFDSAIVTRLVDLSVEETDVDAKVLNTPSSSGYGYYNMSYGAMYQPGFTLRKETAAVETRVFVADGAKQVWAAHSKTDIEQGRDPVAQVHDFVSLMVSKIYD